MSDYFDTPHITKHAFDSLRLRCSKLENELREHKTEISRLDSGLMRILNEGNLAAQGHWDATDRMKQIAFDVLNEHRSKHQKGET